jgi:hypothetical protein
VVGGDVAKVCPQVVDGFGEGQGDEAVLRGHWLTVHPPQGGDGADDTGDDAGDATTPAVADDDDDDHAQGDGGQSQQQVGAEEHGQEQGQDHDLADGAAAGGVDGVGEDQGPEGFADHEVEEAVGKGEVVGGGQGCQGPQGGATQGSAEQGQRRRPQHEAQACQHAGGVEAVEDGHEGREGHGGQGVWPGQAMEHVVGGDVGVTPPEGEDLRGSLCVGGQILADGKAHSDEGDRHDHRDREDDEHVPPRRRCPVARRRHRRHNQAWPTSTASPWA